MPATHDDSAVPEKERLRRRSILGQAAMLGTNVAAGMLICTLLGYYVDNKRGTGHFWTLCGVVTGFLFSAYEFWNTVRELGTLTEDDSKSTTGKEGRSGKDPGMPAAK